MYVHTYIRVRRCIRDAAYEICWPILQVNVPRMYDGVSLYEIVFINVLPMHTIFILFLTRDRTTFFSGRYFAYDDLIFEFIVYRPFGDTFLIQSAGNAKYKVRTYFGR